MHREQFLQERSPQGTGMSTTLNTDDSLRIRLERHQIRTHDHATLDSRGGAELDRNPHAAIETSSFTEPKSEAELRQPGLGSRVDGRPGYGPAEIV